jgi:hypothetical protein
VVKIKTKDGKSEEEWKKEEVNKYGTKKLCWFRFFQTQQKKRDGPIPM